jgi:glutamate 5-kinase
MDDIQLTRQQALAASERLVIKVGTRVLTRADGRLALSRQAELVEAIADLRLRGRQVLMVTSGAVGLGRDALGLKDTPSDTTQRQACAAIGQSRLMALYQEAFAHLGLLCAQVLLTQADFADRAHYLNLRSTLTTLLGLGVIPIINENDVVSTDELAMAEGGRVFGDNDKLSALVASKLEADLLVLLTDVAGVFDRDPRGAKGAQLLSTIQDAEHLTAQLTGSSSGVGRGGMRSKVAAAAIACRSGCHVVIASGVSPGALSRVLAGESEGTFFPATGCLSARRRWIAFASEARGVLHLDDGATRALMERGASLLAAGVTRVEGDFRKGDVLELRGADGALIGRGVSEVDGAECRQWVSGRAPAGARNRDALVDRDSMVLEKDR